MSKKPFFLLEINMDQFIEEFYKEFRYLDVEFNMESDLYFEKEIEKVKNKYTPIEREFLLELLTEKIKQNNNWYTRQLAVAAILTALAIAFLSLKIKLISLIAIIVIIIVLTSIFRIDKNFVRKNNRIYKMINIFKFIDILKEM
ncbi:MAG: hypothetical protein RR595_15575 [Lysinibacillus sp.]